MFLLLNFWMLCIKSNVLYLTIMRLDPALKNLSFFSEVFLKLYTHRLTKIQNKK